MDAKAILLKYYAEDSDLFRLLWRHSMQVAERVKRIADNISEPVDIEFAYNAALIHDIGIFKTHAPSIFCEGHEPYLLHGIIGGEIMRAEGYDKYALVCERHTGAGLSAKEIETQGLPLPRRNFIPLTIEEQLVCYADNFYSKSNPDKEKTPAEILRSMQKFGPEQASRFTAMARRFESK